MIIKIRNRILLALEMISITILVLMAFFTGLQIYNQQITFPQLQETSSIFSKFFFLSPNVYAIISSVLILLIYVTFSLFYITVHFEKTQSSEIIYFALFLVSLLFEFARLFIPFLNLWSSCSQIVTILSRIVLFGRTLAPLSLLFIAIQNLPEQRQNVERNLTILIVGSAIFSTLLPINTQKMTLNAHLLFGFQYQIYYSWLVFTIITFVSLIQTDYSENTKSKMPLGFILLAFGYKILFNTTRLFLVVLGTIFLLVGTAIFLKELHKKYLWD